MIDVIVQIIVITAASALIISIIKTLTNKKEEGYSSFSSFFKIRRTPTITIHASIKTRSMMVII